MKGHLTLTGKKRVQSLLSMCLAKGGPAATELLRNDLKFSASEIEKKRNYCSCCYKHKPGPLTDIIEPRSMLKLGRDYTHFPINSTLCSECFNSYIFLMGTLFLQQTSDTLSMKIKNLGWSKLNKPGNYE